ncbi:3-dehydroquinate synthase [Oceanobacillus sp. FSL H7-0719]|uniref:3-dehydroquinate synthase n=1 Tax=Oceanobacillus sp. FSL H7-0719 TaxID=2954507 RepID=UPI003251FF5D
MQRLSIEYSTGTYPILIGQRILSTLKDSLEKEYTSIFVITDENVAEIYLDEVVEHLSDCKVFQYILPAGEASKNIDQYYRLQTAAIEKGLDRNALILALGGGVVGDLAGFVAATFMRGIDYIQIPTTILAHDSSVGGKVAINHEHGKNLIGAFYPPAAVYYDIATLSSLPAKEIRSGYAELVKEGLISGKELFEEMLQVSLVSIKNETLEKHILAGIKVKADIVEADERELGIRSYLNLGHTFAHALEAELGYGVITHGEAVAVGLLFSIHVSEAEFGVELPYDELKSWLEKNNYPLQTITFDPKKIMKRMKSDKKAVRNRIKMVLLKAPGKLLNKELADQKILNYLEIFKERLIK